MTALAPKLTPLDERVLQALPEGPRGVRASVVYARVQRPGVTFEDVRLVLRGFEHLGRARQRNGWWTR